MPNVDDFFELDKGILCERSIDEEVRKNIQFREREEGRSKRS
jgi:hypothetical protein